MKMQIPEPEIKKEYDVVVVGGGVAGAGAALAAARCGASVLLLEKSALLGGLATIGLINWYEPLCDGKGKKLIGGIAEEFLFAAFRYSQNTLPADWREKGCSDDKSRRYTSHFSPCGFALSLFELLDEAGVTVRYNTLATWPQTEGGIVTGVLCETLSGGEFYPCKMVIDATGTAEVFHRIGCPTEDGQNFMSYVAHYYPYDRKVEPKMNAVRTWMVSGAQMTGEGQPEDFPLLSGTTSDDENLLLQRGQRILIGKMKEKDPEAGELTQLSMMPHFRKIRHMIGDLLLDGSMLYRHFDNSVGAFADFRASHRGQWYEVPYTALFNSSFPNALACGRIISATGEAWEAARVIPVCVLTGEAAGTAAALSVQLGVSPADLDVKLLRAILRSNGNILEKSER